MEYNNKEDGHAGFFRPLINAYIPLPIHGVTAIPGKIAGALMVADAIEDAIPLIHGPIGCSFQRKINPFRPLFSFYDTPCTDMSDLEVVFSGEEKLNRGIKETYEKYHPNLIVVITTCASDLIGDDVESVIEETREDVGCEVVYTTGDFVRKAKPVGAQDALYAITDQMLCQEREEIEKNDCSINIVSLPIHNAALKTAEMASVLSEMGIKINQICFDHTTVRDLYALSKAELTIIDYPMPWTKLMKERLGVDYYTILDLEKYRESKDPELLSPYGIEGSARVFMEIAKRLDKEGEAEEVIKRRKKVAVEQLSKTKKDWGAKRVAYSGMGCLHSIEQQMLLRDVGIIPSVIIYKTSGSRLLFSMDAIEEMLNMTLEWARKHGSDPEVLVNPSTEEEIKAMKENRIDLAILSGLNNAIHEYHKEGIRTFDREDFLVHYQRIGFGCPIELAFRLKEGLKRPKKRDPLLCMLEYDTFRANLTPQWTKLADIFIALRGGGGLGDRWKRWAK